MSGTALGGRVGQAGFSAIGLPSTRSSATKKSNSNHQAEWRPRDRGGGVVGAQVTGADVGPRASAPERCYSLNPCPPCTNTVAARRVSTGSRTPFISSVLADPVLQPLLGAGQPSASIT